MEKKLPQLRLLQLHPVFAAFLFASTCVPRYADAQVVTVLTGTVTNASTGAPVPGARVTLNGPSLAGVITDVNGRYSITGQQWPYTGAATMWIVATGYFTPVFEVNVSSPFPMTVDRALVVGGPILRGTVTDASTGQSIANANLAFSGAFYPGPTTRGVSTDALGGYIIDSSEFTESVAGTGTTLSLTVSRANYTQSTASVSALPPFPVTRNFSLTPSTGLVLQGTVIGSILQKSSLSSGVAGATVTLSGPASVTVITDGNGKYSFSAQQWPYTGRATMWVVARGYFTPVLEVDIVPPFPMENDVWLTYGDVLFRGTITDKVTGQPIANANVAYSSGDFYPGPTTRNVQTDLSGGYAIDSSDFIWNVSENGTTVNLSVSRANYLQATASATASLPGCKGSQDPACNNQFPATVNFALTPSTGVMLRGTVTNASSGAPIRGAAVTLYGSSLASVTTDGEGKYSFTGQQWPYTGPATMWIVARGHFTPVFDVNITSPLPVTIDRALVAGGDVVRGSVTDAATGRAIANASVAYSSGAFYPGATTRAVQTDVAGIYGIDSSEFNETVRTSGTLLSLSVASQPGYFTSNTTVTAAPPFPGTHDFSLTPTGVTSRITIASDPPGRTIFVDGTAWHAPQTFFWPAGSVHTIDQLLEQPGTPGTQYIFSGWSDGAPSGRRYIVPSADTTLTTVFNTQYLLTTAVRPADASTRPGTVSGEGWFAAGRTATVVATPGVGFQFGGFSGDLSGLTNPQTIVMNAPHIVIANFVAATTTTLTASAGSSMYGERVFLTAAVNSAASGIPTGNVSFRDGETTIGIADVNTSAQASFATSSLSGGPHSITAVFSGDLLFSASTSVAVTVVINKAGTATALVSSSNPVTYGQPLTLTATVTGGNATGSVQFRDGGIPLGTAPLINRAASLTIGTLVPGPHSIIAVYSGDSNYNGSSSGVLAQNVSAAMSSSNTTATFTDGTTTVATAFNNITQPGALTVTRIDPGTAGSIPGGFQLSGLNLAYEIATTATFSGQITVCFTVASTNSSLFSSPYPLRILHNVNGKLLDQTVLKGASAPSYSSATGVGTVCAKMSSLSPFVFAVATDLTPPALTSLTVTTNPVAVNTTVKLSISVDDSSTGGSNIALAEYSVDGGSTWQPFGGSYHTTPSLSVNSTIGPFASSNVVDICVRGTDVAQNEAVACTLLAVYDPSAGFVTGGGWIQSPAGAYIAEPAMTGKANFGFVSKYQRVAASPEGNTQFHFQAASFNFKSTNYEWLVIAGPKAQYKGSGTINGAGEYAFLLTATDGGQPGGGGVDRFRIKIWNKNSGGVVYDNVPAASDNPNAFDPQAIAGGSIVIQAN